MRIRIVSALVALVGLAGSALGRRPLAALIILQGCVDRQVDGAPVPEFVQQMMNVDFPADGRVHVQARGRFRIAPTTALCTFRPGYGLDTPQLIETLTRMGQRYRNGQAGVSERCLQGQPVFVLARPENNRLGGPYKIILAVWQGEAACVGGIERTDGVRPGVEAHVADIDLFNRAVNKQLRENSIAGDMADLSRACLARFSGRD